MKKFDLFAYLDQKENKEAFIKDIFYSVFQNLFLKFEVMEKMIYNILTSIN